MPAYDVKRELKNLYAPRDTTWALVDVPEQQFLAIDGSGNPNTAAEYATAVGAVYGVAYTLKFANKKEDGRDFVVAPLEGLWWADDPTAFTTGAKDSWHWTMLIGQPDWIAESLIDAARNTALARKKLPAISDVRRLVLREGLCAQVLHVGPYDDEGPVLAELHGSYLAANGLDYAGPHHEVYLGDPRRADPAKLKTILRQPVRPADRPTANLTADFKGDGQAEPVAESSTSPPNRGRLTPWLIVCSWIRSSNGCWEPCWRSSERCRTAIRCH
ncbi:MAG: GyrI-like domain-containing protein [Microlunatus sp.]|nr:GyrI-like domain-containing protein [Microlunatus sp.]